MENFFFFDKKLITEGIWADLGKAAKAVFPVIACHYQPGQTAFPSQKRIAILSGYTIASVRTGIKELLEKKPMGFSEVEEKKGHYTITIPSEKSKFAFHKSIIESGAWRKLPSVAKCLYPVLRTLSHYSKEDQRAFMSEFEFEEIDWDRFDAYLDREEDFCTKSKAELCRAADITKQSFEPALDSLIYIGLAELVQDKLFGTVCIKVNHYAEKRWKHDCLNAEVKKAFKE